MQFAHIEEFDRRFIMSAGEVQILHYFGLEANVIESDIHTLEVDNTNLTLCYGKFLCQADSKDNNGIVDDIMRNKDRALFCITSKDFKTETLEISYLCYADIKLYEPDHIGWIPFAMAIYGEHKAIECIKEGAITQAIECSFRRLEDPVVLNLFNRIGIFAIKAIEKRIPKNQQITLENWLTFVDDERVIRTAKKIF